MKNHIPHGLFRFCLFILFGLYQVRCASIAQDPLYRGPFPRPEWALEAYKEPNSWKAKVEPGAECQQITLIFGDASSFQDSNHPVQAPIIMDYYRSSDNAKHPAILVSPILGGKNRVATHFARYLSQRGYHCLVVHRPKDLTSDLIDLQQLDDRLQQAVIRDRVALDWLCSQPEVDSNALGSFGVSYGGIKNTVLAGVDARLKVNVFAMAGANFPSLVFDSNHKVMKRVRHFIEQHYELTREQIEQKLRDTILTEPLRFTPFIDPDTTLLILARGDRTVPRANGELLREALGYPRTLYLPCGHYSAALFTGMLGFPYVECITKEFFDQHFYKKESGMKHTKK